ncbi:metallophosphoesterase family protein [Dyadobacter psychrotolerans]|uniref:Metallophosphoesterase n=1 Tax=Dyadobacter psychrotolerans TaxID=2541721 RepID=A0A4R5DRF5_9BACT|nr:metallophosphoesterase [Dyadobacter psychrotolerans]TDE14810.1 metallophosphoesterase [Dyadobacter psychrotolerans]
MKNSCYQKSYVLCVRNCTLFLAWLLLTLIFARCNSFEFSPNQISSHRSVQDLNGKNLLKLNLTPPDDTVTIVFAGDSQRWYSELNRFVTKANEIKDVDFVLIAGDISDFGLLKEFEWVNKRLSDLKTPYFGVIGNHDLTGNGEAVFRKMFGPLDYSFVYDSIKFVAHNTNSLEYERVNVPDVGWLENQLQTGSDIKHIVAVSHVPPFSPLEFNAKLVKPYTSLFSNTPKMLVSLHGHVHDHNDFYPFEDHVRYITSFAFAQNSFVLLKIVDGRVLKTIIEY